MTKPEYPQPKIDSRGIAVAADVSMSLDEWAQMIERFIQKYGRTSKLHLDAGHNNVELVINYPKVKK